MAKLSYQRDGLVVRRGGAGATDAEIRDLQRHLRCLGYLRNGIDGDFGSGTERAVMALRHDLLNNDGRGKDGPAPVAVESYNRRWVAGVTGVVDQATAACIADMLDDPAFPKLPAADDPAARNAEIVARTAAMTSKTAPPPFLLAIFGQESRLRQFVVPGRGDEDSYVLVGLDTNLAGQPHAVTSRGYGVGQYTLFHHPPTADEVARYMVDADDNIAAAADGLREKFDDFITGPDGGTTADDRIAEHGRIPLRLCKYQADDPRYMSDCKACAEAGGRVDIKAGETPWYEGSSHTYRTTRYYKTADFADVPVRHAFECDWPYATRRYNGSGPNSYNYQAIVLRNLRKT